MPLHESMEKQGMGYQSDMLFLCGMMKGSKKGCDAMIIQKWYHKSSLDKFSQAGASIRKINNAKWIVTGKLTNIYLW